MRERAPVAHSIDIASDRSALWLRACWVAGLAYLAGAGALEVYTALHCPLAYTADFLYDDAYYYLGVAGRLARGEGSTFRPPLHTNGYQPLWLLVLAAVAWTLSLGQHGLFVATIALSYVIKLVAIASTRRPLALALGVSIGWMPFVFSLGLETTLLALAVPWLPWLLAPGARSVRDALLSGAGFALLFLVRLDAAAVFAAHALWRGGSERKVDRTLVLQGLVLASVGGVYFALNWAWFGVPVPVSGLAKQLGNVLGENSVIDSYRRSLTMCASLALVHEGVRSWMQRLDRQAAGRRDVLDRAAGVFAVTALITIAYYTLGSGWRVWPWYRWPLALCFVFLFARSLALVLRGVASARRQARTLAQVGLLGLAALSVQIGFSALGANKSDTLAALAAHDAPALASTFPIIPSFNKDNVQMIARMFPHDGQAQTIVMGDRAGGLGYWLPLQHRFVHSEGLVADAAFLRARAEGRGEAFVDALAPDLMVVDRDQLLTERQGGTLVYGVPEPIQGTSMHRGVMLFCFPERAIRDQQALPLGYGSWYTVRTRYVFDYRARIPCSTSMAATLQGLLAQPDGLLDFSMPSEL
jgi:hypothetical protein